MNVLVNFNWDVYVGNIRRIWILFNVIKLEDNGKEY